MSYRRKAIQGTRDANEPEIIDALKRVGATVEPIVTGEGVPDLLVGFREQNFLIEVKPLPVKGEVFASKVQLNPTQVKWHKAWKGQKAVARTPEEALIVIGAISNVVVDSGERK